MAYKGELELLGHIAVSYTHLDVYKRQEQEEPEEADEAAFEEAVAKMTDETETVVDGSDGGDEEI